MPSTYDPLLNIELQNPGENSNLWGAKENVNLAKLAQAIAAYYTIDLSASSGTYTLTSLQGSLDEASRANYNFVGGLKQNTTVFFPSVQKRFIAANNTVAAQANSFSITIATQTGGSNISLNPGDRADIICDGGNMFFATTTSGSSTTQTVANLSVSNAVNVGGTLTVTGTSSLNGPVSGLNVVGNYTSNTGNLTLSAGTLSARNLVMTNPVPITSGGTGATTAAQARINLGVSGTSPTRTTLTSGSGTYNIKSGSTRLVVQLVGGGGGGGGSGQNTVNGNGSPGGGTTFGSGGAAGGLQSGAGGVPGGLPFGSAIGGGDGGDSILAGGTGDISVSGNNFAIPGQKGIGGAKILQGSAAAGGSGGASFFGGGGVSSLISSSTLGAPGSGGCGGDIIATGGICYTGGGGGAATYANLIINGPLSASYSYSVGAGGTGGSAGTSGQPGGNGNHGLIIIDEYYN